jgi:hypothetical protein
VRNHEGPRSQLVPQAGMFTQAVFCADDIAVNVNLLAQRFRAIKLLASSSQQFDSTGIIDVIL